MEVGVIVVAESEEICDEALRALEVDWEVLPFVVDLREGRKPDAPVVRSAPPAPQGGAGGGGGRGGGGGGAVVATIPPKKATSPIPMSLMAMPNKVSRKPIISSNMT